MLLQKDNVELEKLLQLEQELQFETFDSEIAFKIAEEIKNSVSAQNLSSVGIQIYFEDKVVLHYLMVGRKESPWLARKTKTVMDSGHSSLYTFYMKAVNPTFVEWEKTDEYAICGGGFPIFQNNQLKGAICVSGLDHLADHELIIAALTKLLQKG